MPFVLRGALGETIEGDDDTLAILRLVPAVVLNLNWNEEVLAQLHEQHMKITMKEELLSSSQAL